MKTLIFPNAGNELLRINSHDIVYVEADGNYCHMFLKGGGEQDLWFNLRQFLNIVDEQMEADFPTLIYVGRSLVVNCDYIYRINPTKGELVLFGNGYYEKNILHASQKSLMGLKEEIKKLK